MDDLIPFMPSIEETLVRIAVALEEISKTLENIDDNLYSIEVSLDDGIGKEGTMAKLLASNNKRNNLISGVQAVIADGIDVNVSGGVTTYQPHCF